MIMIIRTVEIDEIPHLGGGLEVLLTGGTEVRLATHVHGDIHCEATGVRDEHREEA
jgi:hypothetical protein